MIGGLHAVPQRPAAPEPDEIHLVVAVQGDMSGHDCFSESTCCSQEARIELMHMLGLDKEQSEAAWAGIRESTSSLPCQDICQAVNMKNTSEVFISTAHGPRTVTQNRVFVQRQPYV
jgi:hypothetical protein